MDSLEGDLEKKATPHEVARELLLEAIELKEKGNKEFKTAKMLIKHTAGKNGMTEACTLYAKVETIVMSLE